MKRFVVIVLDGFGIGAMDDAVTARPGDEKANTLRSILRDHPDMKLPNLERLGLMNAYGAESSRMKMWEDANFGKSELMRLWDTRRSWVHFRENRMSIPFRKKWMQWPAISGNRGIKWRLLKGKGCGMCSVMIL